MTTHPPPTDSDFEALYRTCFAPGCRQVARIWRSTATRWGIPPAEYQAMVTDAVHDAFRHVMAHPTEWDAARASLPRWLVIIARQQLRKQLDAAIRHLRHRADLDARPACPPPPPSRLAGRIDTTLARLHQRQAAVLQAHYFQERSVRLLAEDMGVTETAVESLLKRGRSRFADLWVETEAPASQECTP